MSEIADSVAREVMGQGWIEEHPHYWEFWHPDTDPRDCKRVKDRMVELGYQYSIDYLLKEGQLPFRAIFIKYRTWKTAYSEIEEDAVCQAALAAVREEADDAN